MKRVLSLGLTSCALALLLGCGESTPWTSDLDGPSVTVNVAALNLEGVGDVVWDVQVVNGRTPTPDVVWQRRISSSGYGDGAGSASYVGPCDADSGMSENEVRVWVVGVYADTITALGSFDSGQPNGADGTLVPFQNPTTLASPLRRKVQCVENADRPVQFDVALMRPAQQGFFDIAVNFNNIFCSAKLDCCEENGAETACARDIRLLFDAGGQRATTMVLGFACTAGAKVGVETELYLDALALDCTSPNTGTNFAADIVIDPSGPAGNQCAAGNVEGCAPWVTSPGVNANQYLYQVGVYRGFEQLTSGGVSAQKVYWNVALGAVRKGTSAVGIEDCWLKARGTADDALGTGVVDNGVIAQGAVYPYVQWSALLDASCRAEGLSFGTAGAAVQTAYTETGAASATAFAYGFGPNMGPGSFCASPCVHGTCVGGTCVCGVGAEGATCASCASGYVLSGGVCVPDLPCGLLGQSCPSGFTCNTALAEGSSYTAFCVSDGTLPAFGEVNEMVYVPGKAAGEVVSAPRWTFWMGCNSLAQGGADGNCSGNESPQHEVTLSSYAIDRTEVSAQAYWDWCGDNGFDVTANGWTGSCLPSERQGSPIQATYKPTTGAWTKQAHPVNSVTDHQATAYCAAKGKRLCTEAEWERAARGGCETVTGTCKTAMRKYPWGNTEPTGCDEANWSGCPVGTSTSAAGAYPGGTSPYGAVDLSGNVWEWVSNWYVGYVSTPVATPAFDYTGSLRVTRGGYFPSAAVDVRAGRRGYGSSGDGGAGIGIGFRCCRSASPAIPLSCGGVTCPDIPAFSATCNAQDHCEYAPTFEEAPWRADNVWIYVPPGSFAMGAPSGEVGSSSTERPVHTVTFARGFLFSKYPVTTRTYEACEASSPGTCTPPATDDWDGTGRGPNRSSNGRGTHAQNGLTWAQAGAACAWLGGRRPSEAEWEYAANGRSVHRKHPWGDSPAASCANGNASFQEGTTVPADYGCGSGGTVPINSTPAGVSATGATEMVGNLWEWVEDWGHGDYTGAPVDGSAWVVPVGTLRVMRGGGFNNDVSFMRTSARFANTPTQRVAGMGARCVREL